jgi:hypothetical protein
MILCKSSVLLEDEHYSQILYLSWQLLLDRNEELSSCAGRNKKNPPVHILSFCLATLVILAAARAGHLVDNLLRTEMENSSALIRYHAILRFQILWRFRYQFWIRLEEGAHSMMKVNLLIAKKKRLKEFIKYRFFHRVLNSFFHHQHLALRIFN